MPTLSDAPTSSSALPYILVLIAFWLLIPLAYYVRKSAGSSTYSKVATDGDTPASRRRKSTRRAAAGGHVPLGMCKEQEEVAYF